MEWLTYFDGGKWRIKIGDTEYSQEHPNNGLYGFWYTKCGKYIHPIALHDDAPEETRMCKLCAKKEADHD